MHIYFVVPYVPNLIRTRSYNLIRHLTELGHQVTVFTLWSSDSELSDAESLRNICHRVVVAPITRWHSLKNVILALPTKKPLQAVYSWQPSLAKEISKYLKSTHHLPDVIHIEHLRGAQYGLHIKNILQNSGLNIPVVWDSVDCISLLFEQAKHHSHNFFSKQITRFELPRTSHYESWLIRQFDQILITSQADKEAILNLDSSGNSPANISILPNGVDINYFKVEDTAIREPASVIISGKMSYHANIAMVFFLNQEIMPRVWASRPETKLFIVGKDPTKEIQALGKNPAITVTGTVVDIRPYIQRSTVAVVPLVYGAGSQFKILEAMACSTPVVSTPRAAQPLSAEVNREILVAEDPLEFADAILKLLANKQDQERLGQAGRQYVEKNHQWSDIVHKLESIYEGIINDANI